MATYSSTNPVVLAQNWGGLTSGRQLFVYESSAAHGEIEAAGFFVGAAQGSPGLQSAGLKIGDLVMNIAVSTAGSSAITVHRVTSISTSTGYGSKLNASVSVASS